MKITNSFIRTLTLPELMQELEDANHWAMWTQATGRVSFSPKLIPREYFGRQEMKNALMGACASIFTVSIEEDKDAGVIVMFKNMTIPGDPEPGIALGAARLTPEDVMRIEANLFPEGPIPTLGITTYGAKVN
jgi:hypothetical protein